MEVEDTISVMRTEKKYLLSYQKKNIGKSSVRDNEKRRVWKDGEIFCKVALF